jgi:1-acyl-sn-glycerol-3-phosphate acyltransferase
LQPFHDGAFRLAIDTQQSLLPLVVVGAGRLMPPGTIQLRPGLIRIFVGDEIPAEGLTADDIQMLKMKTYEQMKGILETHNSPARK